MKFFTTTICVVLLASAAIRPAHAESAGPVIDWDPAYFWQAGGTPSNLPLGGELKAVGIISSFGAPFDDLNANDPLKEYTFYVHGLTSTGTVTAGPPATEFYTTTYTGGTIEVYEGTPRNSSFDPFPPNTNVPATFIDGTLILAGSFTSFVVQTNNFTAFQVGNAEGAITWTGGSLVERTRPGGVDCPGLFTGGMTWLSSVLIPGYLFRHDGKIDLNCPVPARSSTWGKIKSLYR